MNKFTKYTLINISILTLGVLLGILSIISYQFLNEKQTAITRDTYINFLNETSLLINKNQALHQEIAQLSEDIKQNKTIYEASINAKESISKLNMILGIQPVSGEGVKVIIQKELPYFVFIDMMNDLYTIGAEAISINNIHITDQSGFTENPLTHQVSISYTPISAPYTLSIIGDKDIMYQNLQKKNSVFQRITKAYGIKNSELSITKEVVLDIPAG